MKSILLLLLALTTSLHAELVFDAQKKEIHAPPDAQKIVCDFFFENKGKETVKIDRYESTCSCMSVQINQGGKLEYAPGEKGVLRANFDMENFTGEVDKNVVLWLAGDKESSPSFILVVNVHIPVLVEMQPRTLEWHGKGPWEAKVMKIRMNHTEPIDIVRTTLQNPCFEWEMKTIEKGKEYELLVKPVMKPDVAPGMAVIHIETDCSIKKQQKHMAFVLVRPDLPGPSAAPQLGPAPQGKPE
jgi:hypothetical protein